MSQDRVISPPPPQQQTTTSPRDISQRVTALIRQSTTLCCFLVRLRV